jgi:hypothetical protein
MRISELLVLTTMPGAFAAYNELHEGFRFSWGRNDRLQVIPHDDQLPTGMTRILFPFIISQ